MKRPTIKDVAKLAKVSVSTVSLVLNNKEPVSEKTRKHVLDAILQLDFHPKRVARGLASNTTGNIGFILTDDHFSLVEPFYTKIFLGAEFEARNHNYYILLTTIPTKFNSKKSIPRFVLERNVDGIIIAGRVPIKLIQYIMDIELPVVLVDFYTRSYKTGAVLIDNIDGAYQAVVHLIKMGHKDICFVGGDLNHPSISDRLDGYRKALNDFQITIKEQFVVTNSKNTSIPAGYNAAEQILQLSEKPTAIFACNDAMAIGCIRKFKEEQIKIPDQTAIIGFDDIEMNIEIEPNLSSMHVKKEEMGALAVQQIVNLITNKKQSTEKVLVPAELIIRDSTRLK